MNSLNVVFCSASLLCLRRDLGADDVRIFLHHGVGLIHGLAAQEFSAQGGVLLKKSDSDRRIDIPHPVLGGEIGGPLLQEGCGGPFPAGTA